MLNFFRKIRKQLAEDNKPLKYLRYAIGEIVLVVIGILIALQINTWSQFQSDRILEKKILIDLRAELLKNKDKVNETLVRKEALYWPLANYLDRMAEDKVAYDDFIELHRRNFFSGRTYPSYGVINSFIASGDVNLITNDSLKYLITDWVDFIQRFINIEEASFQGHRRFSEFLDSRFPAFGNEYHHKSSEDLRRRFEQIYNDVEYGNRLITIREHFETALDNGEQVKRYVDQMVQLIDREIEKLE